ncbi:MAG: DoxX family membrane protein [bacterium]
MQEKVNMILRLILGLIFTIFGANKLIGFMGMPELTGTAATFMGGLGASGYFFIVLGIFETASGILLLVNRFTSLALVMLAPITVNIFLFHAFIAQSGLPLGIIVIGLNAYLGYANREKYSAILSAS